MSSASTVCPISFGLDTEDVAEPRWLWHGLLAPGKLTLLTSLWKSGKTTLLRRMPSLIAPAGLRFALA